MLVETGILDGDEGLAQALGHLLDGYRVTAVLTENGHQLPVGGVDVERLLQLDLAQGGHFRQLRAHPEVKCAHGQRGHQGQAGEHDQAPEQEAAEQGHPGDFRLQNSRPQSIE